MNKTLIANLFSTLARYKSRYIKAFLMVLTSNCLLILNPLVFREAIMALDPTSGTSSSFLHQSLANLLGSAQQSAYSWAILLLFISFVAAFFKYQMRIAFISISRDVERQVRSLLFSRIQSQTMAFYDRHGIGELLSRVTNDISAYRDVLGPGIMYPLFFSTLVIPGLVALFSISSTLAAICLIPMLIIPIINIAIRGKIYTLSHKVQELLGDLSSMVQEHYSGIRIVKSYGVETGTFKLFYDLCRRLLETNLKLVIRMGVIQPFFTLLTKLITVFLLLFSSFIILKSWGNLNTADFISFMWIQSYIFFPILMLAWVLPVYQRGRAAYDRLVEIYHEPIDIQDNPQSTLTIPPKADIAFNNLTFSYPTAERIVLSNLNLTIKGGSFVGITGPIGSGKTTLFRLLNREYEIPRGMIAIGGHDIHDYPLEAFRREIVTVEQIPFLFSKTIAENVRFGMEDATLEQLELVAKHADLHDTVMGFPEGYDTLIGERGVTLSGGQKQRVAVARAFLVNRSILLLDDIFSAVDLETETRIFGSMKKNFAGKTVILVTHRVSILEQMDRVVYLSNGKVIEDGTPAELLKKEGQFAALVQLQTL